MAWPTWLGTIAAQMLKGLLDWFRGWYTQNRLAEEEARRKALEAHHDSEKDREAAEDRIAASGEEEKAQADKEAKEWKHNMMLEHLKKNNPH